MRRVMVGAAVALVLFGVGCGRGRDEEAKRTGTAEQAAVHGGPRPGSEALDEERPRPAEPAPEQIRWTGEAKSAASERWGLLASIRIGGEPIPWLYSAWQLDRDLVFYAVMSGRKEHPHRDELVAADLQRRRELWSILLPEETRPHQLMRIPDGPLLLYERGVSVTAYDPRTGAELWRKDAPEPHDRDSWGGALKLTAEGMLMLTPKELALRDPGDWSVHWTVPLNCSGRLVGYAPPVVAEGRIFFIVDDQEGERRRVLAVDEKTQQIAWEAHLGPVPWIGEPPRFPIDLGTCSVAQGSVVCLYQRTECDYCLDGVFGTQPAPLLVCFDGATGERRWERALPDWPGSSLVSDFVSPVAHCDQTLIYVVDYDAADRNERWLVYDLADGRLEREILEAYTDPVVVDGMVMARNPNDGEDYFLEPPSFRVARHIEVPPFMADWYYQLQPVDGRLVVLDSQRVKYGGICETKVVVLAPAP